MALLNLRNILLENGDNRLFDHIDLQIEAGERLCLVGRNGTGKSTLMKLLCREVLPDDGEFIVAGNVRIARLQQDVPEGSEISVFDLVAEGLGEVAVLLQRYHALSHRIASHASDELLNKLHQVQQQIDDLNGWQLNQRVETVISRLDLNADTAFNDLSGGWKRRALLAKALVAEPDLLLLDEPTNHLDIPAIEWLESYLLNFKGTLLFVSHDRAFVQKLATRIIELDRGKLTSWPGDFQKYQVAKQAALEAEATQNALFDKKLAQEEVWIRQGIKARRTRNEGRVRRLEALRLEYSARRHVQGKTKAQIEQASQSGKLVAEIQHLTYTLDSGESLIKDFSTTILRNDKIGIIGPNGVGKTTLIKLILGQLQPTAGKVTLGTKIELAYFDQYRDQFDEEANLRDNLIKDADFVEVNGQKKHVISYLQDFLFTPLQIQKPVKVLSGGERNRLLLARLFAKPSNLLVMDEPTNDLDAETLELLEELLIDYQGTILLISHDRSFLNQVVTRSLVFEGKGQIGEYAGGYDDWLMQRPAPSSEVPPEKKAATKEVASPSTSTTAQPASKAKKLSYKDQRELDLLPQKIEQLETAMAELQAKMSAADFYQQGAERMAQTQTEYERLEAELEIAFARWEELENA
ncbi:ATP-binding cassette domain-containing protein [Thiofilum flexile]|uniref:ATP-binding cassette domain-containing protein n=1 Tax=Thiofilum flexile TaxID=125627 RepID=UPI00036044DB|nr:ATP-binding cassette domain-containing protein [Thiofilum flexile]